MSSLIQQDRVGDALPPFARLNIPTLPRIASYGIRLVASRRILLAIAIVTGLAASAAFIGKSLFSTSSTQGLVFYDVGRMDLPITVTERGNLESQHDVEVLCEVDDINGDGLNGTVAVSIVPNGSSVKKGDLLVEMDSSLHVERMDRQILTKERAKADQIQADAKYENQITQNETAKEEASLKVKLVDLELKMFTDQQNGTHQLEVEEIKRTIDDVNSEILAAQANLELKLNDKQGIESLFKLGYAGKNELDRSRLDYLQAEGTFAAKLNRLRTQMATLAKKETYERQMQLLKLQGSVETARRGLAQVERDNDAKLAQAKAVRDSANETLKKEEELLARYREQVDKCKIYAPQDGMVAYATGDGYRREEIRPGAPLRTRQVIMTLPNLKSMQVKTSVHESVLDQIKPGLTATVKVDAFPDRSYQAKVQTVAVLPDQSGWMSSDTKVYATVVSIDEDVDQLKPGMTAVVEIHVDQLSHVIAVPVQSVVQEGTESWCYIEHGQNVERRPVKLGRTNDKFVEIQSGINERDRIVLNPMSIIEDSREKPGDHVDEGSKTPQSDHLAMNSSTSP